MNLAAHEEWEAKIKHRNSYNNKPDGQALYMGLLLDFWHGWVIPESFQAGVDWQKSQKESDTISHLQMQLATKHDVIANLRTQMAEMHERINAYEKRLEKLYGID